MRTQFLEIKAIDKIAYRSLPKAICKLGEEYGELVQAMNLGIGMKKHRLSKEQIRKKVREEAADLIQNIFLLCARFKIPFHELVEALSSKNQVWKTKYGKKKKNKNKK